MGKFAQTLRSTLAVFATPEWIAEDIKTYPDNYTAVGAGDRFIRINVIPAGLGLDLKSTSGQVLIDIFTPAGKGTLDASVVSDRLDAHIMGKSFSSAEGTLQFGRSALSHRGGDKANPSLHRSIYAISFNFFGV